MKLTPDELKVIKALKRLSKLWPKSLWLYSASGTLTVMRKNDLGDKAMINGRGLRGGGFDPDFIVCSIGIENDGGDW